jgi:hypothetical protein
MSGTQERGARRTATSGPDVVACSPGRDEAGPATRAAVHQPVRAVQPGAHGEGAAKSLQRLGGVAGGPALERDDAGVAEAVQCGGDRRVVDVPRSRLTAPGTSATWISPTSGSARSASSTRFPPPVCAWYRSRLSRRWGLPTALTSAMVSAARANGVPGWSTAVFRFSRVNTRPARSPSSASRVSVRYPVTSPPRRSARAAHPGPTRRPPVRSPGRRGHPRRSPTPGFRYGRRRRRR